jgi:tetratricopeptide (TPR) repeat protein
MGRKDEAMAQYRKTLELDPHFPLALLGLSLAHADQGKFDDAIHESQMVVQALGTKPYPLGILGYIYAAAGKDEEAKKVLNQVIDFSKQGYSVSVLVAMVYVGLNDKDKAFEWLEQGYRDQNSLLAYIKVYPPWASLRSDPRYTALLKKMGLDK